MRNLTILTLLLVSPSLWGCFAPTRTPVPSFNCKEADGTVQTLVCNNAGLAKLDQQLNHLYQKALTTYAPTELNQLKAFQRGWIKGRDDCWKATEVESCVTRAYQRRITELQVRTGDVTIPAPDLFDCGEQSLTSYFYHDTLQKALIININDQQQFLINVESDGSYTGQNLNVTLEGDTLTLERYGGSPIICKNQTRKGQTL